MVNVEMLKKLYDWAVASQENLEKFFEKNPKFKEHNQGDWGKVIKNGVCQTAFCLAGQTAVLAGYTFLLGHDELDNTYAGYPAEATSGTMIPKADVHSYGLKFVGGSGRTFARPPSYAVNVPYDQGRHASDIAQEELGLDEVEASRLFAGHNDVDRIRHIINDIFADHGVEDRIPGGDPDPTTCECGDPYCTY